MKHPLLSNSQIFFAVNALACVGLNIGVIGVNWFIIDVTGSNRLLGIYGACSLVSAFFTLALAGTLTDRYSKLTLLQLCCAGQAILFFLASAFHVIEIPVLWIIYGLAIFNMPLMVLFSIVSRGAIASIWAGSSLKRGNALLEITLQIGAMCAALLTGILYHFFGFSVLIGLAGLLCLMAAILLSVWPIAMEFTPKKSAAYIAELKEGFLYLIRSKKVFLYGLCAFIPTVVISVSNTVIPGYVEQSLGKQSVTYGLGDMWFAVGALLAGIWGTRTKQFTHHWLVTLFSGVLLCLGALFIGRNVLLFYLLVFVLGVILAQLRILLNTVFMKEADTQYLGRSLSLLMALAMALQAILSYGVGSWMDIHGAASGFIWLLGISLLGMLLLGLAKRVNNQ